MFVSGPYAARAASEIFDPYREETRRTRYVPHGGLPSSYTSARDFSASDFHLPVRDKLRDKKFSEHLSRSVRSTFAASAAESP
jgi:hypothetical protein